MKNMKKVLVVMLALVLALSLFTGCGNNNEENNNDDSQNTESNNNQNQEETITIGSVIMNTSGEWFAEVIAGQEAAAETLGVKFNIVSSDNEVSKEFDNVSTFVAQEVDAICISPLSADASVAAIESADEAGIPVVNWNTTVNTDIPKGFVGVSNYQLGALTGEYAKDYIEKNYPDGCKMAILQNTSYEVGVERCNGFKEAVEDTKGLEIVAAQDAELQEEGMDITEQILTANPDIQVLWAWNQTSLLGAVAALENANRTDIVVMGTDMSLDLAKDMIESEVQLQAITTQQPFDIGYKAVENAVAAARGENVDDEVLVPLKTYTKDNTEAVEKYIEEHEHLVE